MKRFVKEYANYRKADEKRYCLNKSLIKDFNREIDKIVRIYDRGMITTDEAMKCLYSVGKEA